MFTPETRTVTATCDGKTSTPVFGWMSVPPVHLAGGGVTEASLAPVYLSDGVPVTAQTFSAVTVA